MKCQELPLTNLKFMRTVPTMTPVRIPRDAQTLMHPEVAGLFPAGEGAGYAGGIISAALDGERIADAVVNYLKK